MPNIPDLATVAALLGDPTRSRMLAVLMDGGARTATELALEGGVTASTASSHLTRLSEAGLLRQVRQGRHRYYEIASRAVAQAIEGLMSIAPAVPGRRPGPQDERLRRARVCYDHLAGEAGVAMLDAMRRKGFVGGDDDTLSLTARGEAWCGTLGVDLAGLRSHRRRLCRSCLDWSERRAHLAGALGAALLARMEALRYVRRDPGSRVVHVSPRGARFLEELTLVG